MVVVAIFSFLNSWNDFMGPLIYLNDESKYTLSLGLQLFQGNYSAQWHLLMAAAILVLIPAIIVFFLGQKQIMEGIATTGIKDDRRYNNAEKTEQKYFTEKCTGSRRILETNAGSYY